MRKEKMIRKSELTGIALVLVFMNWFTFEMITRYETILPPTEITWVVGIFTGLVVMVTTYELANRGYKGE